MSDPVAEAQAVLEWMDQTWTDLPNGQWNTIKAHLATMIALNRPLLEPAPYADVAGLTHELRESTVDYDGSQMPDGAEPRRIPTCGEMRQTADMLERLSRERARQSAAIAKARGEIDAVYNWMREPDWAGDVWSIHDWARRRPVAEVLAILAQIDSPARVDEGAVEDTHRKDMANVGEYLMDTLESNRQHPLLKHWLPADNPAEIVVDLLNAHDDKAAQLDALTKGVAAVREGIDAAWEDAETSGVELGLERARGLLDQHLPPAAQPASEGE